MCRMSGPRSVAKGFSTNSLETGAGLRCDVCNDCQKCGLWLHASRYSCKHHKPQTYFLNVLNVIEYRTSSTGAVLCCHSSRETPVIT